MTHKRCIRKLRTCRACRRSNHSRPRKRRRCHIDIRRWRSTWLRPRRDPCCTSILHSRMPGHRWGRHTSHTRKHCSRRFRHQRNHSRRRRHQRHRPLCPPPQPSWMRKCSDIDGCPFFGRHSKWRQMRAPEPNRRPKPKYESSRFSPSDTNGKSKKTAVRAAYFRHRHRRTQISSPARTAAADRDRARTPRTESASHPHAAKPAAGRTGTSSATLRSPPEFFVPIAPTIATGKSWQWQLSPLGQWPPSREQESPRDAFPFAVVAQCGQAGATSAAQHVVDASEAAVLQQQATDGMPGPNAKNKDAKSIQVVFQRFPVRRRIPKAYQDSSSRSKIFLGGPARAQSPNKPPKPKQPGRPRRLRRSESAFSRRLGLS